VVIALNPPAAAAERDVVVDAAERDRALVEAHRSGDPDAFTAIVHLHHDILWRLARRRLGNTFDAEDAVQETLLRAFRGLDRFGAGGDWRLAAWLTRIMANVCADLGARRLAEASLADRMDPTDRPAGDAAELASDPVALTAVRAALGGLPLGQRQAFVLRAVDDLPYRDIADQLGISEENARARVQRARTALRHALDNGVAAAGALAAVPLIVVRRLHLGVGRATGLLRRHGVRAATSAATPPTPTGSSPLAGGTGSVLSSQTLLSGPIAPLSTGGQLAAQATQLAAQASASPIVQAAVAASSTAGGRGSLVMGLAASLATAGALSFPSGSGPMHRTSPAPSAHDAAASPAPVDGPPSGTSAGSVAAAGSSTSTANAAADAGAAGAAAPTPPTSGHGGAGAGGDAAAAGPTTPSWVQLVAAGAVTVGGVAAGGRTGTAGTSSASASASASGQGSTPTSSGSASSTATSPSSGPPATAASSGSVLAAGSCAGIAGFPTLGTLPTVAPSGSAAISAMLDTIPVNLTTAGGNPTFGGGATVAASAGLAGTSLSYVVGTCLARQGSEIAVQLDGTGGNEVLLYGSLVSAVPTGTDAPATPTTAAAPGTSTAAGLTYFFRGTVTQIGGVFDSQGTLPWGLGPQFVAELQIPEPANTGQLTVAFLDPQAGSTSDAGSAAASASPPATSSSPASGRSPATGSSGAASTTPDGGASGSSGAPTPAG
jgi:RNA polymerase sigma-70 factor (ECF subfamily)